MLCRAGFFRLRAAFALLRYCGGSAGITAELFFFFAVLLFGLLFCQCCPTGEKFQLGFSFICAAVCSPEFCPLSENDEKL